MPRPSRHCGRLQQLCVLGLSFVCVNLVYSTLRMNSTQPGNVASYCNAKPYSLASSTPPLRQPRRTGTHRMTHQPRTDKRKTTRRQLCTHQNGDPFFSGERRVSGQHCRGPNNFFFRIHTASYLSPITYYLSRSWYAS